MQGVLVQDLGTLELSRGRGQDSAASRSRWAHRLGILVVCVYFFRATVLPQLLHVPVSVQIAATIMVLVSASLLHLFNASCWRTSWGLFLLACALGLPNAMDSRTAITRYVGLALVVIAVGPQVCTSTAVVLRSAAWAATVKGLPMFTGICFAWYILQFPSFGPLFTAFMSHSMLLGPCAGMGAIIALARALHGPSWKWAALAAAGTVPVVASGSRIAALATAASACVLLGLRKPLVGLAFAAIIAGAGYSFATNERAQTLDSSVTGGLAYKGMQDTRTELWRDRISDFQSSPIVGIGIGMGTGSGAFKSEDGATRVEPGSSYLAILAMTGGTGTLVFLMAVGLLVAGFVSSKCVLSCQRDILIAAGVFLAVHGIAEGWVISFGSPLCCFFWLWLGRLGDAAVQGREARLKRGLGLPGRRPVRSADLARWHRDYALRFRSS